MDKKLYVGNLSYNTTSQDLQTMFAEAGKVDSATIITDRDTGQSKGFGFVEMSTPQEAQEAIKLFDGRDMDGRKMAVNIARPKEDRPRTGGNTGGRSRGGAFGNGGGQRGRSW